MKKICIALALMVAVGTTNVWAKSENSVNRIANVKDGMAIENVYLKIEPKDEVETGSVIYIDFENAKVFSQEVIDGTANEKALGYKAGGYQYKENGKTWSGEGFGEFMKQVSTNRLPYNIKRMSNTQIEVRLINVPELYCGQTMSNINGTVGAPIYYIPMVISADGVGDVTATIDDNGTTITGGSVNSLGDSVGGSGSTTTSIDSVTVDRDEMVLDTITIKENTTGTFKTGASNPIKLQLNSGFEFKKGTTYTVSAGSNLSFTAVTKTVTENTDSLSFYLPNDYKYTNSANKVGSIQIKGLVVVAENDDTWGDVYLSISGGGIKAQSIKTEGTVATTTTEATTETTTESYNKEVKVQIGSDTIYVDGTGTRIDAMPYIQLSSQSTMVPLRAVSVALGGDIGNADNSSMVEWDAETKTVTIKYGERKIQFTAGSNRMIVDGKEKVMSNGVVAEITNSRMYVPFRALGEALNVNVAWDAETKTAVYEAE